MCDDAERPLSLRQADQARADLYAIYDELDFIKPRPRRPSFRPWQPGAGDCRSGVAGLASRITALCRLPFAAGMSNKKLGKPSICTQPSDPQPPGAKACGVKMGRKPNLTHPQRREPIRSPDKLGDPVREIACRYNVSPSTISRLMA
jgi:hypothetical protein